MSIDKVWVLAEIADGAPITTSLELLAQARAMGGTVEAVAWGPDTAAAAADARRPRRHHRLRRR